MLKRTLGGLLAMFALGASVPQQAATLQTSAAVHAKRERRQGVTQNIDVRNDLFPGGKNPYKHYWPMLNQRQYRKLCRQVPSLRKSKKHRSKN